MGYVIMKSFVCIASLGYIRHTNFMSPDEADGVKLLTIYVSERFSGKEPVMVLAYKKFRQTTHIHDFVCKHVMSIIVSFVLCLFVFM